MGGDSRLASFCETRNELAICTPDMTSLRKVCGNVPFLIPMENCRYSFYGPKISLMFSQETSGPVYGLKLCRSKL